MRIAARLGLFTLCLLFTVGVWPFLWELNLALSPHIPWSLLPVAILATYTLLRGAVYTADTFRPLSGSKIASALTAGAVLGAAQVGIYLAYSALFDGPPLTAGYLSALPWVVAASFCATDSLVSGIFEEFAFRGLLQPGLERALGRYAAIAITTALFVASHAWKPGFAHLAPHFVLVSITYGYIASTTRSFVLVAIVHSIHNALAYLVTFVAVGSDGLIDGTVRSTTLGAISLSVLAITIAMIARRWPRTCPASS
jgi:membrane protease YdiL (CAAX protease family)